MEAANAVSNMIKSELIAKMADSLPQLSAKQVAAGVKGILARMTDSLSENCRIEIRGFGTFSLHYRPPRNAHNPRTGEKVITEPKYSPHFKAGKELRELVDSPNSSSGITSSESEHSE